MRTAVHPCPFNTVPYAASLRKIGEVEVDATGAIPVFRRSIPATDRFDGVGPWPYLWIDGKADIEALYTGFRHLVTLGVVTQPGYRPEVEGPDAVLLKQHYVYDPSLPTPELSRRARKRLARCEEAASFDVVADVTERLAIVGLYEAVKLRHDLAGGFFDHDAAHFEVLARLADSVFFRVADDDGTGAMACGVVFGDVLQILHMPSSEAGLRWNASYLLMHGLQDFARQNGLRLMTGGLPAGATDGLRVFKERWANDFLPVYLLRIVNDRARYAELCASSAGDPNFFPSYRRRA
ncbi:MAG TPA: hypothetical protein VIZ90_17905 [Rhizobiaceae bacterium]